MKPSVARRCKDQVREDGGRGDRRDARVWRVCTFFGGKERNRMLEKTSRIVRVNQEKKREALIH